MFGKEEKDSFDPARDFPYDIKSKHDCLNTITSRILFKLFTVDNFDSGVSFHGGDNVIAYPWGSFSKAYKAR